MWHLLSPLSLSLILESPPQSSTPGSSRGTLGRMIFGRQATSPAESGHVSGIAKSGALPFLLHPCSGDM